MASRFSSRVKIITLALWNSFATLGRRKSPTEPKRILIAHHLLLGDTLMLTPLLAKLREQYPAAEIIMATPKAIAPLYEKQPYGVKAIPFDPRDPATFQILFALRGFDLAIVPGDNRHSWLARALGAKWVIAHAADHPAYKNWAVDTLIPYPDLPATWGDMVAALMPGKPPEAYRPADWPSPAYTPFQLPNRPYCVLHVGASSPLKHWDNTKWLALAEYLSNRGYQVIWSGGKGEEKYIATIDPEQKFPSCAGQLTLPQMWHLIKNAALLVCPDTGIAHLGRLVNAPTITLFGPGSDVICGKGEFWSNSPYHAVTIEDFPCRNQQKLFRREISWVRRCGRSTKECNTPQCMHAITLPDVTNLITEILGSTQ
ncbi:glycosyltransferase family 9 protein [Sulfurirhabdus autotrophica]|uniref:ADP-heptose:LPS heptosyltransferase n=1 Tax=Sulfurirhabdus autotrophica TaxID=1706046 RepID=A0A4V2W1I8_9PROT|nr:glycosyltransferase family 9 protein [Sulfurirhabdus autotrophica]TCV84289.1 ADP-heptose:LPS heptosyltransferase [Sulfurirhabdus autotrophica]